MSTRLLNIAQQSAGIVQNPVTQFSNLQFKVKIKTTHQHMPVKDPAPAKRLQPEPLRD
jgi:hypothetical protein